MNRHRKDIKFLTSENRSSPRDLTTENASKRLQKWWNRQLDFNSLRFENIVPFLNLRERIFNGTHRYLVINFFVNMRFISSRFFKISDLGIDISVRNLPLSRLKNAQIYAPWKSRTILAAANRPSPRDSATKNTLKRLQNLNSYKLNFKRLFCASKLDAAVIQPQFLTKRGRHFTPKTAQKNDKFQTPKTRHFWTLKMARKPLRIPYEMPPQNGLKKHTENRHFLDPQNNTFRSPKSTIFG